jgi:hypothetical protein
LSDGEFEATADALARFDGRSTTGPARTAETASTSGTTKEPGPVDAAPADGTAAESVLPSSVPPALRAQVAQLVRAVLEGAPGREAGEPLARLAAAEVVDGMLARTESRARWVALAQASAALRQGVVQDLAGLGRERSARDAAREQELVEAVAEVTGREPSAGEGTSQARADLETPTGPEPAALVRGLPGELGYAVNGLAPLVNQVVASGLPVESAARLLEVMREALVDTALARVEPGAVASGRSEQGSGAVRTAEELRAELTRRWNEGPGMAGLADPGPWTDTLVAARAASDLLRSRDGGVAGPTSMPVNAATTRVEAFADAFAGVLGNTLEAQAAEGLDAGALVAEVQLARDLALVNPTWDASNENSDYNCLNVVQAYELRRRGYDAQTRFLSDEELRAGGRSLDAIEGAWGRAFTTVADRAGVDRAFAVPGSRGVVQVAPRTGLPGHVFNVENVDGRVRYVDAQSNVSDASFYFQPANVISHLRLDDLALPEAWIEEFAQPADPSARFWPALIGGETSDGWHEIARVADKQRMRALRQLPETVVSVLPLNELSPTQALQAARQVAQTLAPVPQAQDQVALTRLVASDVVDTMRKGILFLNGDLGMASLRGATFEDLVALGQGPADAGAGPGTGTGALRVGQGLPERLAQAVDGLVSVVDLVVASGLPVELSPRLLEFAHGSLVRGGVGEAIRASRGPAGSGSLSIAEMNRLEDALGPLWWAAPAGTASGSGTRVTWEQTLTEARTAPGTVPDGAQQTVSQNAASRRVQQYVQAFTDVFTRAVGTATPAGPVTQETSPVSTASGQAAAEQAVSEQAATGQAAAEQAGTGERVEPAEGQGATLPGARTVAGRGALESDVAGQGLGQLRTGRDPQVQATETQSPAESSPIPFPSAEPVHAVESVLPSFLPPSLRAQVAEQLHGVLEAFPAADPGPAVMRLAAVDVVDQVLARTGDPGPSGWVALAQASASLRQGVVQDLVDLGRERFAQDAAGEPGREAELQAGREAEQRSLWIAELHEVLAEDPVAALSMAREREQAAAAADGSGQGRPVGEGTGETGGDPAPGATVRGLPGELGYAVNGLAPLVSQVVASGLPVELSALLLEGMREALADAALTVAEPGAVVEQGASEQGGAVRTPEQLRAELTRRWNEGPGVVRLTDPGPWADTLVAARAAGDLLRSADGAAGPTSVPVNAATTRVEAFADAFAAVLGDTLQAQAADGLDAGVSVAQAQLARDLALVNPTWDPSVIEGGSNCVHVVQAYELRRRGYDVQATVLPEEHALEGARSVGDIEAIWGRSFTAAADRGVVDRAFATPGSRGIVRTAQRADLTGHVFNVENVNGRVRYLDAQSNTSDARFYFRSARNISYLRLDDLALPGTGLEEFVEPADPTAVPVAPLVGGDTIEVWDEIKAAKNAWAREALARLPQAVVSVVPSELSRMRALEVGRRATQSLAPVPLGGQDAALTRLVTADVLSTMVRAEAYRLGGFERQSFKDAVTDTLQPAVVEDLAALGRQRAPAGAVPGTGSTGVGRLEDLPVTLGQAVDGLPSLVNRVAASGLPVETSVRLLDHVRDALVDRAVAEASRMARRPADPAQEAGSRYLTMRERQDLRSALIGPWVDAPGTASRVDRSGGGWAQALTEARSALRQAPDGTPPVEPGNAVAQLAQQRAQAFADTFRLAVDVERVNPWRPEEGLRTPRADVAVDNSVAAAQVLELRRRGFDAQLPDARGTRLAGSATQQLRQAWGRGLTTAENLAQVESAFLRMGPGARGVVVLNGNVSGSRVINVENVHGRVRFVDGRLNLLNAGSAVQGTTSVSYLRWDNLPLGRIPSSVALVRSPLTQLQTGRSGSPETVDGLMGLGHQRLDAKDSRESTVSRVQDRPPLLVLTEGLTGAARQVAVSWPGVPAERSGVPVELVAGADSGPVVAQRLREACQQVARGLVRELVAGEDTRATLSSLVNDPAGPFGEVTWGALAERLEALSGRGPAVRAAVVEEQLAGVSREFQAAVARWVLSHEWFRRPATGAASSPGAGPSGTGTGASGSGGPAGTRGRDGAGGSGEARSGAGLPESAAVRQDGGPRPEADLTLRRDRLLAAIARLDGGQAAVGPADARTGPAAPDGQLAWTPPASWTERLAERGLRGREFDLPPNAARVIAAIRGVQEIGLLEFPPLAATNEVNLFLVERLSAPVAGDVARRVLEWQARQDLAARLTRWGTEAIQVAGGDLATTPEWRRVQAGVNASFQVVLGWADHLGANRVAREGLTETELAEPAEFVRILREAAESGLRQAERDLDPAAPDANFDAQQLAVDLSAVADAQYEGAWAELTRRVTQRRLGAPGPEHSREALAEYLGAVLEGGAVVPEEGGEPPQAGEQPAGEPPRGEARHPVPVDRMNTVWGPTGLSEDTIGDLLAWYELFPKTATETVRALRRAPAGRLSSRRLGS